ncbi:MAG TPA: DUF72 domain-containing protein [Rhizomicrobium sp.]|jgi:uncharacterized protein YecE (DUF72 family)
MIRIGTAGWAIRREHAGRFGEGVSHLARYATRFNAVEINSSFYRPHRPATYARWTASVPQDFRFSVKLPKTITHTKRLKAVAKELDAFLAEVAALDGKLGPLLAQLPPSLAFDRKSIEAFAKRLRGRFTGAVVFEPRHASWFSGEADGLLAAYEMARVAADPAVVPAAALPGGWDGFTYWRLHGSPRLYYSDYEPAFLNALAARLSRATESWVIFDNTALGFATANAFALQERLR